MVQQYKFSKVVANCRLATPVHLGSIRHSWTNEVTVLLHKRIRPPKIPQYLMNCSTPVYKLHFMLVSLLGLPCLRPLEEAAFILSSILTNSFLPLGSEPTPVWRDEAQHTSGKFHQSFSRVYLVNRLVQGEDIWFLLKQGDSCKSALSSDSNPL